MPHDLAKRIRKEVATAKGSEATVLLADDKKIVVVRKTTPARPEKPLYLMKLYSGESLLRSYAAGTRETDTDGECLERGLEALLQN